MSPSKLLSIILALGAAQLVSAQCGYEAQYPNWYCDVCGDEVYIMDGPEGCVPVNATFDDIKTGPLNGTYSSATWSNFEVTTPFFLDIFPHIVPFSSPNYAKVAADTVGTIHFQTSGGEYGVAIYGYLYSLEYACADPYLGIPVSCNVMLNGSCADFALSNTNLYHLNQTLQYNASLFDQNMTLGYSTLPHYLTQGVCVNTSLSAVSETGGPVDLFIDSVIFGAIYTQDPVK